MFFNPWHDIGDENGTIGVIEIPVWSYLKLELDKTTGMLILDRINSKLCPSNYGFIPRTISNDSDPLDIFVVSNHTLPSMTQVKIKPYGVIYMTDAGYKDEKIIATVVGEEISNSKVEAEIDIIYNYLLQYKSGTRVDGVGGVLDAKKVIKEAQDSYDKVYRKVT